jgi:murein DD-endopeptidase MepM/ murein hydrolase activator NlpD
VSKRNNNVNLKVLRAAALALAIIWLYRGAAQSESPRRWIASTPGDVFQGGILELRVPAQGMTAVEGRFAGEKVFFDSDGVNFTALLGVDLEAKPGPAKVYVQGRTPAGGQRETQISLKIKAKAFPQESFAVAPEFDQLGPEVLERIRVEREQFARAFASSVPSRLWEKPFVVPLAAEASSPFGYRRIINGMPRAPHTGLDLRAPMGSEVTAANNGRVALTGDFFYSGKSVVLDHGGGLYTMYFHLSEIRAEQQAEVRKGDVIALSGMTGRVTGPHLHWAARLNGARIDPLELVQRWAGKTDSSIRPNVPRQTAEPENGK